MGSNLPKSNRSSRTRASQQLADGLNKHQARIKQMVIDGETLTTAQVVSRIEESIAIADHAVEAKAAWLAAAIADVLSRKSMNPFNAKVRAIVLAAFSKEIDVLADFGLTNRKVPELTPEQRQAAVAKAKATRKARHTMGKRQKAAITGETAAAEAAVGSQPPGGTAPAK